MKKKAVTALGILCTVVVAGVLLSSLTWKDRVSDDYVRVRGYRHLAVRMEPQEEISGQEVEAAVWERLSAEDIYQEDTSSEIKEGDLVNLSFRGYFDGDPQSVALEQEDYNLRIGSRAFPEGFEEALTGKKPGGEEEIPLAYPESYENESLAGRKVVFDVRINCIKRPYTKDTLTDAVVRKSMGVEDVDGLYAMVREDLEEEAEKEFAERRQEAVWEAFLETIKVKQYNESYLEEEYENYDRVYEEHAQELGVDLIEFLTDYCDSSLKEYSQKKQEECRKLVKKRMAVEAVAKAEGLEGDSYEELSEQVEKLLIQETTYTYEQE